MSWQVLIFFSVVLFSLSTLLQRTLLKDQKSDPIAYSIFFQLLIGLLIGAFGFAVADMSLPDLKPLLPNLLLTVLLYTLSNIFIFNALKRIEASKYSVVFSARVIFTVLASSLILKEGLTFLQAIGGGLLLVSVLLVTLKRFRFEFSKGEAMAFLAAVFFGLATTNDRFLLKSFNLYPYVSLAFIAPPILMAVLYPRSAEKIGQLLRGGVLVKMIVLCITYAVSSAAFFAALQIGGNSSQVATVNLSGVILTVILAVIFLRERDFMLRKIGGAILSFIGLVLLSS